MAPCALRPQVTDTHVALQMKGAAYNLAPDAHQALLGQNAIIQFEEFLKKRTFALRHKRGSTGRALVFANLVYQACALFEKLHQLCINVVNLLSQLI